MHMEDVQGMLNETAGIENHYDIKKTFLCGQGELRFRVYDNNASVEITCSREN